MSAAAPVRPRFVFPTTRRGWLLVITVALLLGVAMLVENGTFPQRNMITGFVWLGVLGIVVCALLAYPLPFVGLVAAVALSVANVLVPGMPHGGGTELIVLLFMIGFFAYRLPGRWSLGAWLITGVSVGLSTYVRGGEVFEIMFYLLFTAPGWFVGSLLQREKRRSAELVQLAAELAAERERGEQSAILAERTRIARELHDAVAHSVSVMTLQVGVVRRRLDALPTEQDTLRQAEQLGRQSVDELRRIVGLVRPDGPTLTPVPSLNQLDELIGQVRTTGTAVTLTRNGSLPEPGTALDVSAYRIVQEALTNAIKHAPGAAIAVQLDGSPEQLEIAVSDDGPAVGTVRVGNGLTGMTERVTMFGGTLRYGPGTPRGFAVTAVLPTDAPVQTPARTATARPAATKATAR